MPKKLGVGPTAAGQDKETAGTALRQEVGAVQMPSPLGTSGVLADGSDLLKGSPGPAAAFVSDSVGGALTVGGGVDSVSAPNVLDSGSNVHQQVAAVQPGSK